MTLVAAGHQSCISAPATQQAHNVRRNLAVTAPQSPASKFGEEMMKLEAELQVWAPYLPNDTTEV